MIVGNVIGAMGGSPNSYEIVAPNGTTLLAVATPNGEEQILDATVNDVRVGKTFATSTGIQTGTKDIPSYQTTSGTRLIRPGDAFTVSLPTHDAYDYTRFQCMIAPFNTSLVDSVCIDKISLNDKVYPVNSTNMLSAITKNTTTKSIDLNITNDTQVNCVIHFFTYKEED